MKSIDDVLHLSVKFGVEAREPGVILVEFVFSIVWQLLDASLDDEGLLKYIPDKASKWLTGQENMDIDGQDSFGEKRHEHHEGMCTSNSTMAIELVAEFLKNKATSSVLYLARQNMYEIIFVLLLVIYFDFGFAS